MGWNCCGSFLGWNCCGPGGGGLGLTPEMITWGLAGGKFLGWKGSPGAKNWAGDGGTGRGF